MSREALLDQPGEVRHPRGVRKNEAQLDMDFAAPVLATPTRDLAGMVRGSDPIESQRAAVDIKDRVSHLQRTVLTIIASEGPVTAKDLERHIAFRGYAANTPRKRLSELAKLGKIVQVGREDGCGKFDIPNR